ncbi:MAG: FHIPEP family type III secretion protein [Bdellovibrionota bacterium]
MKKSLIQGQDFMLALFVLSIMAMLVIPLPTSLLDFLLVINISFSLLLLLAGLYMPNALALLSFPSLLLLTTLFRLGLNVASTRLILSQGDAGHVIETFGTFLIKGEITVGVIIFLIITIVNFIVIAKGASRVSEVAARFSLESLPGKQMAIDSDLRSGVITTNQAREKREDLRKESQLYGAMDGAMKFIQGDVIAGFFITLTNIFGGMFIGLKQGMPFNEALQTYTMLTVGDGLVSQIPALLISICAGIVVTRVSSGENTTLGKELGSQLFASPGIMIFTGFVLFLFAALPGLPAFQFILVGLVFVYIGFHIRRKKRIESQKAEFLPVSVMHANKELLESDNAENLDCFEIWIDRDFGDYVDLNSLLILQKCNDYKDNFLKMTGFKFPTFKFVIKNEIAKNSFKIYKSNTLTVESVFADDMVYINVNKSQLPILGLKELKEERHPIYGSKLYGVKKDAFSSLLCKEADIISYDKIDWILLNLVNFCINNPIEFFSISDITIMLKELEKIYPATVKDLFSIPQVSSAKIFEVYKELIRQGVFYISHREKLEGIISYFNGYNISSDSDFDVFSIVSSIRKAKKLHVVSNSIFREKRIKLCSISDELQEVFEEMIPQVYEGNINLDAKDFSTIKNNLLSLQRNYIERGIVSFSIISSRDLIPVIYNVLRIFELKINVIDFDELTPDLKIEHIGVWRK